jgi:AAA domain-containing protein
MTEEINNNDDLNGYEVFIDSPIVEIGEAPPLRRRGGKKPYKLVMARDITVANTTKAFLIDGFLGAGEVSIWFGPPECGKSTALIDAGCHVATGRSWCGRAVNEGPVLYVAAERGQVVQRRILAWRLEHEIDDFPLAVIDDAVDLRTGQVDANRIIEAANKLKAMYGKPVAWIVFDTLSRPWDDQYWVVRDHVATGEQ